MARFFIDDSGSSNEEPIMYLGGWVGQVQTWDKFVKEWKQTLDASNPKPIDYFKHFEARSLSKCFAGFTESQANEKMLGLAEVVTRHNICGVVYMVGREYHRRLVQEHALSIRGKINKILKDPFFTCMNGLMCRVLGLEYKIHPDEKVDFIFDGKPGSRQSNRVMTMYQLMCDYFMPEPYRSIMGTAIPMDDKDVLPLQAADFLVGQVRAAFRNKADPEPLALINRHRPIILQAMPVEDILHNIGMNNAFRIMGRLEREKKK